MKSHSTLLIALALLSTACSQLKPFDFEPVAQPPFCGFPELKLPAEVSVFAAGAYSGRTISYQIDQSGHQGTQIDVAVNSSSKPVVLVLGAYEPTIWNVGWSEQTRILAVLVGGYHRQAIAGLEKETPLLISTYDNRGACGFFYVTSGNRAQLDALATRVFGRPVDSVFPAVEGKVVVGEPLVQGAKLVTSSHTSPESFYDRSAPLAGPAGLEDAVRKGLLRRATPADLDAWAGAGRRPKPSFFNAYVVLKPFTYPAGLYGANAGTFLVPKGVPKPLGNPGHSAVYDFNTLDCQGASCAR